MSDHGQFTASLGVRLGFSAAYLLVLFPCLFLSTRLNWVYKERKDTVRSVLLIAVISLLILYFIFDIAFSALLGSYTLSVENVRALYSLLIMSTLFTFLADFVLSFLLLRGLLSLLRSQDVNVEGVAKASKMIGYIVIAVLGALNLVRMVFYCDSYGITLTLLNTDDDSEISSIQHRAGERQIWSVKVEVAFAWIYLVYTLAILFGAAVVGIRYRQRDQLIIPLFAATIFTVGARFLMFMIIDFLEISSESKLNITSSVENPSAADTNKDQTDANIVIGVLSGLFTVLYCVGLVLLGTRKPVAVPEPTSPGANRMTMMSQNTTVAGGYDRVDYKHVSEQGQAREQQVLGELPAGQEPVQLPAERTDFMQELGTGEEAAAEETVVRDAEEAPKKKGRISGLFSGSKDKNAAGEA